MRLSDVLSKPLTDEYVQIEGFMDNNTLTFNKQRKITVGKIALNFYCKECNDTRTFYSSDELYCIGVDEKTISIDCVLKCFRCESSVQIWFLVESNNKIAISSPFVRIKKRSEKLSETVLINNEDYDDFTELLEKAQKAYCDDLGAGAIIYLRKILERITVQVAEASNISTKNKSGRRKPYKDLLKEVDKQHSIIPKEFSENGYRLFGELSDVVHGDYDEQIGLNKYKALRRLVVGIIDKVRNDKEIMSAIGVLGWDDMGDIND